METLVVRKANEEAQRARDELEAQLEQERLDALLDASDDDDSRPASGDRDDDDSNSEDDSRSHTPSMADAAIREAADLTLQSLELTSRPNSPP